MEAPAVRADLREVSAIPPATRDEAPDGRGVAARIVPAGAVRPRRTRQQLLDLAVVAARVLSLLPPALVAVVTGRPLVEGAAVLAALVVAAGLTLVRGLWPSVTLGQHVLDTVLVVAVLAASGGTEGPLVFFGVVSAFALGANGGLAVGLAGASALAATAVGTGFFQDELFLAGRKLGEAELTRLGDLVGDTITLTALFPLAAVIGGLVARVLVENRAGQATLLEANRVLATLERLAAAAPDTLSPGRVARAAAVEFRRALDGRVALVLFERGGTLVELGRDGDHGAHVLLDEGWQELVGGARPRSLAADELPGRLARQLPELPAWVAVPLLVREHPVGVVLVGGPTVRDGRAQRQVLHDLGEETAIAIDNTQLFSRIEQVVATAERERLARDLHDGVAQQLTHVRLELELLARTVQQEGVRSELARLSRIAESATDDVRSTIRGLRAQALDVGLVPALRALVTDLSSASGPELELDVRGAAETDPDTATEIYRIVQEALSNALRHARAERVVVEVDVVQGLLLVAVEDDGAGRAGPGSDDGDGLGLRTMRARAARLGAQFVLRDGDDGGTRVELRLPVRQDAALRQQENQGQQAQAPHDHQEAIDG